MSPLDFNGYFDGRPLFSILFNPFATQSVDPMHIAQHLCIRRQVLDRILYRASAHNLNGIEHFAQYLKEKYRRNCRPRTMQITADALMAFLSFFHNLGKDQIDQICRQDIEAFIEHEQDRGLKPNSVRTRLCVVYAFFTVSGLGDAAKAIHPDLWVFLIIEGKIPIGFSDPLPTP